MTDCRPASWTLTCDGCGRPLMRRDGDRYEMAMFAMRPGCARGIEFKSEKIAGARILGIQETPEVCSVKCAHICYDSGKWPEESTWLSSHEKRHPLPGDRPERFYVLMFDRRPPPDDPIEGLTQVSAPEVPR